MRVRRRFVFAVLGLILGLSIILGPVRQDDARALEAEEQRLLELINDHRQANGVAPLTPSETLSVAARRHSEDMATYDFFSHTTEESSYYPAGSAHYERPVLEGYPTSLTAENIAWDSSAEGVFEMWLHSPVHDTNMLNGDYTATGIGRAGLYWTTDFGPVS